MDTMLRKETMGKVTINSNTVKKPISLIGEMAGPCYGTDTSDKEKNYKRGLSCLKDGHFRTLEFAEAWLTLDGYSAKVIRELYTHIGGSPTRLQASTRYIKYQDFDYVVPPKIKANEDAYAMYKACMNAIMEATTYMQKECGIPQEDSNMVLPLGMETTVCAKYNARTLMAMSEQRLCARAYWEFRELMQDIINALSDYSEEWKTICNMFFKCKCDKSGYCLEHKTCGKHPKKAVDES